MGPVRVLLVTGPSGAGRSTAINALEDIGFESIDNLPLSLVPRLLEGPPHHRPLVLGIDPRNRDFSTIAMLELVDTLMNDPRIEAELVYLDCSEEALIRRFSETRRRHPLDRGAAPQDAIALEMQLLEPIRVRADHLIDTSALTPHDLRAEILRWFDIGDTAMMTISVQSFSYKRGLPRGVDMVFDCRFLSNPHWVPELRPMDGRDERVQTHVAADQRFEPFLDQVFTLVESLLPAFVQEGKSKLSIAFGCTGGKHRSVVMAEKMCKYLADTGWQVSIRHRELERELERRMSLS